MYEVAHKVTVIEMKPPPLFILFLFYLLFVFFLFFFCACVRKNLTEMFSKV